MILLFFILFIAVCFDVQTFRIPNQLILTGYGGGILYQIYRPGEFILFEFLEYILCAFLLLVLLIPLFKIRVIGGGDVKLFSVCGLFAGFEAAISIILYAFFIGAFISVMYLAYRRFFLNNKLFPNNKLFSNSKLFPNNEQQQNLQKKKSCNVIHFSIPVLLGTVAHCLLGGAIWQF